MQLATIVGPVTTFGQVVVVHELAALAAEGVQDAAGVGPLATGAGQVVVV